MEFRNGKNVVLAVAASVGFIGLIIGIKYPKPKELPNRLDKISEDAVEIDNDEVYATFDWWYPYNPLRMSNAARVPFFLEKIRAHFRDVSGKSHDLQGIEILDVGCGGGLVTEQISLECKAKVIGLDLSKESIRKARIHAKDLKIQDRLSYIEGSAYQLPFQDSSIDAVICSDVFEHLHDVTLALEEISRVLRPNGLLVYDTINRTTVSFYITIVLAQEILGYIADHAHDWRLYITPEEMFKVASQVGLKHESISNLRGMRPTLPFPWSFFNRLYQGAGRWALLDHWILTKLIDCSYLGVCTKA